MKLLAITLLSLLLASHVLARPVDLLPRVLHPAYWDWVRGPGEMYGFWLWTGPVAVQEQVDRTGENATSMHLVLRPVEAESAKLGVRPRSPDERLADLDGVRDFVTKNALQAGVGIGEHNNAAFVRYPDWFWQKLPNAAMRDRDGKIIRCGDFPWPAMDDPQLRALGQQQMAEMVGYLGSEKWLRYWVIGGEEMYPDYIGLPEGDFRPASLRHYAAWKDLPLTPSWKEGGQAWHVFRESAMVDHFAEYAAYLRSLDPTRPILIPTHGNPFALDFRQKLGYDVAGLAGAADGFEAGPIAIDDDGERLVRMTLDMQSCFGVPVSAPRIADKILDPSAKGGGRSFSPASARRFMYEALGLGVWHIGLVQWAGTLLDGEWGIAGTQAEAECRNVFGELKRAAPYLDNCSRLQPQVGLYVSDDTWREWWRDRWTLLYDLAIKRGWQVTFVTDAQLGADVAASVPVILSVDNTRVSSDAKKRITAYKQAGGRVLTVGEDVPDGSEDRVTVTHRTHTIDGANEWRRDVTPLPMDAIEAAIGDCADPRPVIASEAGKPADGIEILPLTDGTNMIAVVVNRTGEKREVRLSLSRQLRARMGHCVERDVLSGDAISDSNGCEVAAFGTALIAFEPANDAARAEVESANAAIARWRSLGVDARTLASLADRASDHLKANRLAKACALARTVNSAFGLKITARVDSDALRMQVKAWDAAGKPADGASTRVRIVPGPFQWRQLKQTSPGVFALSIPRGSLPVVYDASAERYELPQGAMEIIFDCRLDGRIGAARCSLAFAGTPAPT